VSTPTRRPLAIALLAALLTVVALGAPAHADPDRLRLSLSQAGPFTESLSTPLFSGSYVPGTATSSFYVQNDSPSTTRATISLVPKTAVNAFEAALSFRASVGGQAGDVAVPLYVDKKKNQCRTIVTGPTINPGGVQKVDVTMLIDSEFPQPATQQTASFSFVVTLSQVTNKGKVDVCGPQSPGGQSVQVLGAQSTSAKTTSPTLAPASSGAVRSSGFVAGLAAGVLGAGALLLVGTRRRRRTEV
jgi:hypothetical protein